jgi:uncharacterized protein (DUF342 family)
VHADGDIIVRGRIDNAAVESSGGGVYVDQGIVARRRGAGLRDVKAPLIRGAKVECFGSLYVREIIFQLMCGQKISSR